MVPQTTATEICEKVLKEHWSDCEAKGLPASWTRLKNCLLKRRIDLLSTYEDVIENTRGCEIQTYLFFDSILCAASAWAPEKIAAMRSDRKRLEAINEEVSDAAANLRNLVAERDEIENRNSFGTNTHYHIVDVIEEASERNYLFQSWVHNELKALRARFDMKYWPNLSEIFSVIEADALRSTISVEGATTQAALDSTRPSKADFCRALFKRVEEQSSGQNQLNPNFKLKDESWASLVNCLLDLGADELVEGSYIKHLRQRSRDKSKSKKTAPV